MLPLSANSNILGFWCIGGRWNVPWLNPPTADTATGAALSFAVNSSRMVKLRSVMLMTPEEVDAACEKTVNCRAPGR